MSSEVVDDETGRLLDAGTLGPAFVVLGRVENEEETVYAEAVLAAILEAASAEDTEFGLDDEPD